MGKATAGRATLGPIKLDPIYSRVIALPGHRAATNRLIWRRSATRWSLKSTTRWIDLISEPGSTCLKSSLFRKHVRYAELFNIQCGVGSALHEDVRTLFILYASTFPVVLYKASRAVQFSITVHIELNRSIPSFLGKIRSKCPSYLPARWIWKTSFPAYPPSSRNISGRQLFGAATDEVLILEEKQC